MSINTPGANALDELPQLVRAIAKTQRTDNANRIDPECRKALYACSLVSELAYYHVPQFELDIKRRVGIIPCEGHRQLLVSRGYSPTNVSEYLRGRNFGEEVLTFVITSRGIIVVGVAIYDVVFVSFRGSHYVYDWRVNLNAGLLRGGPELHYTLRYGLGVHAGFFEEEQRVHELVNHELLMLRERKPDVIHVFFTGHSLGGAIAAICGRQIKSRYSRSASSLLFGAPRYHGNALPASQHELSIQRRGDLVPNVPPRVIGYVDHRRQLSTRGEEIVEPIGHKESSSLGFLTSLVRQNPIAAHDIEGYRRDLGRLTHSALWDSPLVDASKL